MLSPPMKAKRSTTIPATPGSVRIIAGQWRGRKLPVPDLPGLRPTPDRVRETLFNWLMPVNEGARCLDLFAGTGALGLEAASRGAAGVVLVERDRRAAAALREHAARLDASQVHVDCADGLQWLAQPASQRFDIVFLDPPYADRLLAPAWKLLCERGWLAPQAYVYAEWPLMEPSPIGLVPWRSGRAGQVAYALYRCQSGTMQGDPAA